MAKTVKNAKVDLTLLKKTLEALEVSLASAEKIVAGADPDKVEWTIEMSKATGLLAGIMTEAALLTGDIQHIIQGGASTGLSKMDALESILGGFKGPTGTN